jgi:hypothetical protein
MVVEGRGAAMSWRRIVVALIVAAAVLVGAGTGSAQPVAERRVFAFGDATFVGPPDDVAPARATVAIAGHPSANGYWLVDGAGGVSGWGTAAPHGSIGDTRLNQPIVGLAATPTGDGYWLVAADGGVFAFGTARFQGAATAHTRFRPVVGIAATASGQGYWIANQGTCGPTATTDVRRADGATRTMLLDGVRVGSHPCHERVTFSFETPAGQHSRISYEGRYGSPPFVDTAGRRVSVQGNAFLVVRVEPGGRVDLSGPGLRLTYTGPVDIRPTGTSLIRNVRFVEDFEANMIWIIGLDRRRAFEVFEIDGPDRLVVDIQRASG